MAQRRPRTLAVIAAAVLLFSAGPAFAACTDPAGNPGEITYNTSYDVFQGCTANAGWVAFHTISAADPCAGSPAAGTVCSDGSVYAGLSPDGNVKMFTTPSDGGNYQWGTHGTDTTMDSCDVPTFSVGSCRTGASNTTLLVTNYLGSEAGTQAAEYCDGLSAHGRSDWYLPAIAELGVLYTSRVAIGGFNTTGGAWPAGWYWASTEDYNNGALSQNFANGTQTDNFKYEEFAVRCVRK